METREASTRSTILIVETHPVCRFALSSLVERAPDLSLAAAVSTGAEALALEIKPDLAVIDYVLSDRSGISLLEELRKRDPEMRGVILSTCDQSAEVVRAIRAGARGYVLKSDPVEETLRAIRRAMGGGLHVSGQLSAPYLRPVFENAVAGNSPVVEILSQRELEVLHLLGFGLSTRQIGSELGISVKTVQSHIEHLRRKLDLGDTQALSDFALCWAQEKAEN